MTLGEGKRKVLMIIDEYSSGGTLTKDDDINLKMNDFFDLAQRDAANHKPILKSTEISMQRAVGTYQEFDLPERFVKLFRVWDGDRLITRRAKVRGGKLLIPNDGAGLVVVEYIASPASIDASTPDDYVFEVAEDAAACMPYYVATLQLLVDLVLDYQPPLGLYDRMIRELDTSLPGSGHGRVVQSYYR